MIRLYIAETLHTNARIALDESRAHYVRHVMRLAEGDKLAAFNGSDGEWEASVTLAGKRDVRLHIDLKIADPRPCPDISFAFAMIKNKSELVVEKATELGVRAIFPIITQHSVVKTIHLEKLRTHAIEAAEQCERFDVPTITPHKNLGDFLSRFPNDHLLLYGDESGASSQLSTTNHQPCCILIGPEGGFSADEHRMLRAAPFARGFGMGPRILRADTAAVAALACVMSMLGDWNDAPHFRGAS